MKSTVLGKRKIVECRDAPPNIGDAPPLPCNCACPTTCPPKVRLKDYIRITPNTSETCFLIGGECGADLLEPTQHCFIGYLRKRGECTAVATLQPVRATIDGKVCFAWNKKFWECGDGKYELDIAIDSNCLLTVGLDVLGCYHALVMYDNHVYDVCKPAIACAPQIDQSDYDDEITCGSCE